MQLKAEHYQQIIKQLCSEQSHARTHERRGSPRVGLRAQVRVIPCSTNAQAAELDVWVRDVSTNGIGLLLPHSLKPGTYLVMSLPADDSTQPALDLLFVAVRCEDLGNGQFAVGASFQRAIHPEDVK